jgi:hypothetical protein
MTMPDSSAKRSGQKVEPVQDIIPATERSQDAERTELADGLTLGNARPLTEGERKAADRDVPVADRVYAPASERVPVAPVPGHREFTDHTDTHTPERKAASHTPTQSTEPSFARVTRPNSATMSNPAYGTHDDTAWNTGATAGGRPYGLGWVALGIGGGVGGWLFLRWQRERNKPINRLRRQAKQAAGELRERVPSSPEEAVRPAAGLTTALLSIAIILWQQAQARSRQADKTVSRQSKKAGKRAEKVVGRAAEAMSEVDWQKHLKTLKKRWDPSRLELEKISISRH